MIIIDQKLLDSFKEPGACSYCGAWLEQLDPHHILCRGMGGGGRIDLSINIVALCRTPCHSMAQANNISRPYLFELVAKREKIKDAVKMADLVTLIRNSPKGAYTGGQIEEMIQELRGGA